MEVDRWLRRVAVGAFATIGVSMLFRGIGKRDDGHFVGQ